MQPGHGQKLGRKQEQAIAALLTRATVEEAAEAAGVSRRTLQAWLKLPAFAAEYGVARRAVVEEAVKNLQRAAGEAVVTLVANLDAPRSADAIRAARAILDLAIGALERDDLQQQLDDLKARLDEAEARAWQQRGVGGT
jgi:hypothetical protein